MDFSMGQLVILYLAYDDTDSNSIEIGNPAYRTTAAES